MTEKRTFTSSQVARAAGMSGANFRMQFAPWHYLLVGDDKPENGAAHQFTFGHALTYALARKISDHGFSAAAAFRIAVFGFASEDDPTREAFQLYHAERGRTLFVVHPPHEAGSCVAFGDWLKVFQIPDPIDPELVMFRPNWNSDERGDYCAESVAIIDLTALQRRVMASLEGESA